MLRVELLLKCNLLTFNLLIFSLIIALAFIVGCSPDVVINSYSRFDFCC